MESVRYAFACLVNNQIQFASLLWHVHICMLADYHLALFTASFNCGCGFKVCPHLYENTNEACETEANPNKCQKVVCFAFAYTANEAAFRWYLLVTRMSSPVSEIDSFCSLTSYYRELAVSKKKNKIKKKIICYILCTLDSFFEAKYTSISVWLQTYFSLKYRLQTDSVRLFPERSPHKRMLFSAPRLHVHINISLIFAHLMWHLCTDVDIP